MAEVFSGNLKSMLTDFISSSGESQTQKIARDVTDHYDIMDFQDAGTLPSGVAYSFESVKNPRTGLVERGMAMGDVEMIMSGNSYRYYQNRDGRRIPISQEEAMALMQPGLAGLGGSDADKMNALIKSVTPSIGAESKYPIAHPKYKDKIPEYFDEERIFYESFGKDPEDKNELLLRNVPEKRRRR